MKVKLLYQDPVHSEWQAQDGLSNRLLKLRFVRQIILMTVPILGHVVTAQAELECVSITVPSNSAQYVANQLNNGGNTVAEVMPVVPNGTIIHTYSQAGGFSFITYDSGAWSSPSAVLGPGRAFYLVNTSGNPLTINFRGKAPQGALSTELFKGFNLVASQAPRAGDLTADLNFPTAHGDIVYKWDVATQDFHTYSYSFGNWFPSAPQIEIGEGFFVKKAVAATWNTMGIEGLPCDFSITPIRTETPEGPAFGIKYNASPLSYYIIKRSVAMHGDWEAVNMRLGIEGVQTFYGAAIAQSPQAFYRVAHIPLSEPTDTDSDFIDDVWELEHSLDPLNPADSAADPDGNGFSALFDYVRDTDRAPKLTAVRVANPSLGVWTNLVGAASVYVEDSIAYVAANEAGALTLFDVSTPTGPTQLSTIRDGEGGFNQLNGLLSVCVEGTNAFLASYRDKALTIIDVSDPNNPQLQSEVIGGQGPYAMLSATAVCVKNNIAYITGGGSARGARGGSLTLIDVSDPKSPVWLSHVVDDEQNPASNFQKLEGANSVFANGTTVYVTSYQDNALTIIDASNPSSPQLLAEVVDGEQGSFLAGACSVFVSEDVAYVASYLDHALNLFDVSDPAIPVLLDTVSASELYHLAGLRSVYVQNNVAFVAAWTDNAVTAFDVSDPTSIKMLRLAQDGQHGFFRLEGARSVFVHDNLVYVAAENDDALTIFEPFAMP